MEKLRGIAITSSNATESSSISPLPLLAFACRRVTFFPRRASGDKGWACPAGMVEKSATIAKARVRKMVFLEKSPMMMKWADGARKRGPGDEEELSRNGPRERWTEHAVMMRQRENSR